MGCRRGWRDDRILRRGLDRFRAGAHDGGRRRLRRAPGRVAVQRGRHRRPLGVSGRIFRQRLERLLRRPIAGGAAQEQGRHALCLAARPAEHVGVRQSRIGRTGVHVYDSEAAHRFWAPSGEIARDVTILHFGSLSLIDEPAADHFAQLMVRQKGRCILTLDPNIRPTVVRGKEAAYRARLAAMLGLADVIKISGADLEWLDPLHAPAEIATVWLAGGASIVVVTAGADGSTAYARDGRTIRRAALPIKLVDTVGAGDSFMGALLAGLDAAGATTPAELALIDDAAIEGALAFAAQV